MLDRSVESRDEITDAQEHELMFTPCDTCGIEGPEPRLWLSSLDDDGGLEYDTEREQWFDSYLLVGSPRCWKCCGALVREALVADFVEAVQTGIERGVYSQAELLDAASKAEMAFHDNDVLEGDPLAKGLYWIELRAMRQRIEAGRTGTWLGSVFVPGQDGAS